MAANEAAPYRGHGFRNPRLPAGHLAIPAQGLPISAELLAVFHRSTAEARGGDGNFAGDVANTAVQSVLSVRVRPGSGTTDARPCLILARIGSHCQGHGRPSEQGPLPEANVANLQDSYQLNDDQAEPTKGGCSGEPKQPLGSVDLIGPYQEEGDNRREPG